MLEAVTSVLQTAPVARGNAEQVSNARSFAANPDKVQEAPRAPYISPFIYVDVNYDKAVLQIRDSDTGDVITQFPSESRLQAQSTAEQARSQESAHATVSQQPSESITESQGTAPAPQPPEAPAAALTSGSAVTAQQLAAFKTASTSASAGNGGQVSLFA